jgi:N-acetylglucosaminyldiphosphoundecaprenol N-acetyl-beta-D-mannosaminyltransferase
MTTVASPRRVDLFGLDVDALDSAATLDRAFQIADARVPSQHVALNAAKVVLARRDDRLREIIRGCDLVSADGSSVVWASRVLGRPLPERIAGIDLFQAILERAEATGHRVYFLGSTQEVLDEMLSRLRVRHPRLQVAGARNGYWDDDDDVIARVAASDADFLFLALPSPRKEFWLRQHLEGLSVPFVMGVGGSFDVLAGRVRRAPSWVQRIGCEWVWRLGQEPRRMWKRYMVGNSRFVALTLSEWWRLRRAR